MVAKQDPSPNRSNFASPPAVELEQVARRFGRQWPLRAVSMRVDRGEGVALLGRNGSGKTTLLRILATTLRPTRGSGRVFGHELVQDADLVRERIGILSHAPGLYPDLTAAENLEFAQRMYGDAVEQRAIDAALDRVGMAAHARERVRVFSAGMTRRVALARMLLKPHDLLLLDEPYASFDTEGIAMLNDVLLEARSRGAAVLIATHDPDRAATVCGRMLEIDAGQLVEIESSRMLEPSR
jgi:heme exporter protein A